MRYLFLTILVIVAFNSQAQRRSLDIEKSQSTNYALVAEKNGSRAEFLLGRPVRIIVKNDLGVHKRVKGYITEFSKDSVMVDPFRLTETSQTIAVSPNDIEKIRRLSRRGRKTMAYAMGGALVYSGVMAMISKQGPYQYVLFLPAILVGGIIVYAYPASFLIDLLSERSSKHGFVFSIQQRRSSSRPSFGH